MHFHVYDQLRNFCLVADHTSFSAAAETLNLTKGAVSYQIDKLESELGFRLFDRRRQGIRLTPRGRSLKQVAQSSFATIEQEVLRLQSSDKPGITIGMATYFASRWLSPRLMHFITAHPDISLRIQPLIDLSDLHSNNLDIAVRWGKGVWRDTGMVCELIFQCPAVLTASRRIGDEISRSGIEALASRLTLLHDRDDSVAWSDWFAAAGFDVPPQSGNLVIPDPNVRVQAVIDGQGIGLYDWLVADEVAAGRLSQYESIALDDYGYYLIYPEDLPPSSPISVFRDWIMQQAENDPNNAGKSA